MGTEIEMLAAGRGHAVVWKLGSAENPRGAALTRERVASADAVFEFTTPAAAVDNLVALGRAGATAVCGTTGWTGELPRVRDAFETGGGALVWAANFSVGVRHFLTLTAEAARLLSPAGYAAFLVEEHHAGKRDAPSGTARLLADAVARASGAAPPIASVRAGTIPGTHRVGFESPEDEIDLVHRARGRAGFAKGAVWAAERVAGRRGVFEFGELLKEVS